jgi:hypothetical protein
MYLMKLRYGEKFGSRAGSCWRLLFVYVLMPWLHKYRVSARPRLLLNINDHNHAGEDIPDNLMSVMSQRFLVHDPIEDDDDDGELNSRSLTSGEVGDQTAALLLKVAAMEKEISRLNNELRKEKTANTNMAATVQNSNGVDDCVSYGSSMPEKAALGQFASVQI